MTMTMTDRNPDQYRDQAMWIWGSCYDRLPGGIAGRCIAPTTSVSVSAGSRLGVLPTTSGCRSGIVVGPVARSTRVAATVPATTSIDRLDDGLIASLDGMAILLAVVALYPTIVTRSRAFLAHVSNTVAVAALHDTLVETIDLAMARLEAVVALLGGATTSTTASAAVGAVGLDVTINC